MTTILLTRPERRVEPLRSALESSGATVLLQPTIEIRQPDSWNAADAEIRRLTGLDGPEFDWVVFSSPSGVDFFLDRLDILRPPAGRPGAANGPDVLKAVRTAAVGPGTDAALRRRLGRGAELLPETFSAEGLLEKWHEDELAGKRFLLPRGDRGRDALKRALRAAGAAVTEIVVYRSVDVERPDPETVDRMRRGEIDWVTATSSAVARSLVRMFGETLHRTRILSISPLTSATLRELGFPERLEARNASAEGMLDALRPWIDRQ